MVFDTFGQFMTHSGQTGAQTHPHVVCYQITIFLEPLWMSHSGPSISFGQEKCPERSTNLIFGSKKFSPHAQKLFGLSFGHAQWAQMSPQMRCFYYIKEKRAQCGSFTCSGCPDWPSAVGHSQKTSFGPTVDPAQWAKYLSWEKKGAREVN